MSKNLPGDQMEFGCVITSFEHLQRMAANRGGEFAISLAGGIARSSKSIKRDDDGEWDVHHNISDTWVDYETDEEFKEAEPNIMEAIEKGALAFLYEL